MTMYVRLTDGDLTLSFSSPDGTYNFILDGFDGYEELPLWAAQEDGFQRLWAAGKVQVATDDQFNNVITEIPARELAGTVPLDLPLNTVQGASGTNPGTVLRFLSSDNAHSHFAFENVTGGQPVQWGVWHEGLDGDPVGDVDIITWPGGNGRLWVGYQPVVTALAQINYQNPDGGDYVTNWQDTGKTLVIESATPCRVLVPTEADGGWQSGAQFHVIQRGTGSVTIVGETGDTSITALGDANAVAGRFAMATLTLIETNLWTLTGQITTVTP